MHGMRWGLTVLGLALVMLAGCADQTAIELRVTSPDLVVPDDLDQLRFLAVGESGVMADRTTDLPGTWPQTFVIRPGSAGSSESVLLTVRGLRGGAERIRRVLRTRFESGSTVEIDVSLSRDCIDVMCSSAEADCVSGRCTNGMTDGGVDMGGRDMGIDSGIDMAVADLGGRDMDGVDMGIDLGADLGVDTGPPDTGPADVGVDMGGGSGGLFISEYVEGGGTRKALELYNAGSAAIDLGTCNIRRYSNGMSTPLDVELSGTIAAGDAYVICSSGFDAACVNTSGAINHNGNDAYDVFCGGVVVDTFGQIGTDPGAEWSGGGVGTQDATLRRKCSITEGDPNGADAFDPSIEWDGFAIDTFSGLGSHCL